MPPDKSVPRMKILEIGPGKKAARGPARDTMDCRADLEPTLVARWGFERIPATDETYDLVVARHVLEHVPWYLTVGALTEARRILRPGGRLRVWVPDLEKLLQARAERRCGDGWRRYNRRSDSMLWFNGRLLGYEGRGRGPENWHRAVFDNEHLTRCFDQAGFVEVQALPPTAGRHGWIDLGVTGKRPAR